MKKRIITLALSIALCVTVLCGTAVAAGTFTDVPDTAWYYEDVQSAYDLGLITGKTATTFGPEDNLTLQQAITLAARIYSLYVGDKHTFDRQSGDTWYAPYERYAVEKGIISAEMTDGQYGQPVTRAEYMQMFANALPAQGLKAINYIPDNAIPDVPSDAPGAQSIYTLYRAGIVQGTDNKGSCKPDHYITRGQVAAVLVRMMQPQERKHYTLPSAVEDGYTLEDIRAQGSQMGYGCFVSFLGYADNTQEFLQQSPQAEKYKNTLPFLWQLDQSQYVDDGSLPGNEIYCIIPCDENVSVVVQEYALDPETGEEVQNTRQLYSSQTGQPFIIRCNVSDIIPNVRIIITDSSGNELIYSPSISLRDGAVSIPDSGNVGDLTLYG